MFLGADPAFVYNCDFLYHEFSELVLILLNIALEH
jgi:hypothetical protein